MLQRLGGFAVRDVGVLWLTTSAHGAAEHVLAFEQQPRYPQPLSQPECRHDDIDGSALVNAADFVIGGGWIQFCVGGGIVADSVPELEYEETWHKAQGMLRAFHDTRTAE